MPDDIREKGSLSLKRNFDVLSDDLAIIMLQ